MKLENMTLGEIREAKKRLSERVNQLMKREVETFEKETGLKVSDCVFSLARELIHLDCESGEVIDCNELSEYFTDVVFIGENNGELNDI